MRYNKYRKCAVQQCNGSASITRCQSLQRRLTARVSEAGQSIFFVLLLINVPHNFQSDVDRLVNHSGYERQQRQNFQQSHCASPLCRPASGRFAFQKSPFPGLPVHSMEWFTVNGYRSMTTCNADSTLPPFHRGSIFILLHFSSITTIRVCLISSPKIHDSFF